MTTIDGETTNTTDEMQSLYYWKVQAAGARAEVSTLKRERDALAKENKLLRDRSVEQLAEYVSYRDRITAENLMLRRAQEQPRISSVITDSTELRLRMGKDFPPEMVEKLLEENKQLRRALEQVEWVFDYDNQKEYCPWCMPNPASEEGRDFEYPVFWKKNYTHAPDCERQKALGLG